MIDCPRLIALLKSPQDDKAKCRRRRALSVAKRPADDHSRSRQQKNRNKCRRRAGYRQLRKVGAAS